MLYHKARKNGEPLSVLGFGAMRLPLNPDGTVDRPEASRIIRWGIDQGINYVDTAYVYHNGLGEECVGEALSGGYRDRVRLATKLPVWKADDKAGLHRILDEELRNLRTDHIDYYLVHSLNRARWKMALERDIHQFLDEARAAGKIVNVGFSHHDSYESFREVLDSREWDFCQIQYNYMDQNYQAGIRGGQEAASRGMSVMIMEPLRGGMLARVPQGARDIFDASGIARSPAGWGLRWVWDQEFPTVVLSGMSDFEQVRDNVATASESPNGCLSPLERETIEKVRQFFAQRMKVGCTRCGYCMPCPQGVLIPECFAQYNNYYLYEDSAPALRYYGLFTQYGGKASDCVDCGRCESLCPQGISIRQELKKVAALMEAPQE